MTGTNCDQCTHNQSRSYLNHLVFTLHFTSLIQSHLIRYPFLLPSTSLLFQRFSQHFQHLHFTSLVITFLTLFLKPFGLQGKSLAPPQVVCFSQFQEEFHAIVPCTSSIPYALCENFYRNSTLNQIGKIYLRMISGFRRGVDEIFALAGVTQRKLVVIYRTFAITCHNSSVFCCVRWFKTDVSGLHIGSQIKGSSYPC